LELLPLLEGGYCIGVGPLRVMIKEEGTHTLDHNDDPDDSIDNDALNYEDFLEDSIYVIAYDVYYFDDS
jgi:hypothetical protein